MPSYGEHKKRHWDGENKSNVRYLKLDAILKHLDILPTSPRCLTFPGATALFEQLLVANKITVPSEIHGIQRCKRANGFDNKSVLQALIESVTEKTNLLFGMPVFGGEFRDFVQRAPAITAARPFHIIDADICCSFDGGVEKDIVGLSPVMATQGLLFITHQKGRERPAAQKLLEKALQDSVGLFGPPGGHLGNALPRLDALRLIGIPVRYTTSFFESGIELSLRNITEYRDINTTTNKGSWMIQYVFVFNRSTSAVSLKGVLEKLQWPLGVVAKRAAIINSAPGYSVNRGPVYNKLFPTQSSLFLSNLC